MRLLSVSIADIKMRVLKDFGFFCSTFIVVNTARPASSRRLFTLDEEQQAIHCTQGNELVVRTFLYSDVLFLYLNERGDEKIILVLRLFLVINYRKTWHVLFTEIVINR